MTLAEKVSLASTLLAAVAAIAAGWSAWESRKASRSQLVNDLLKEGDSERHIDCLQKLHYWRGLHGDGFVAAYVAAGAAGDEEAPQVTYASRVLASYFERVHAVWKLGFLSTNDVKQIARRPAVQFLLATVAPLVRAINPEYPDDLWEDFRGLWLLPRSGSGAS